MNDLLFYLLSIALIGCSLSVVFNQYPVHAVLSLISAFVLTAVMWLDLGAEFLALALIFVYVGAVMALFLFIVFMLNVDFLPKNLSLAYKLSTLSMIILVLAVLYSKSTAMGIAQAIVTSESSNTLKIGMSLYLDHWLAIQLVALVLLVAMLAAVTLVGRHQKDVKRQKIEKQIARTVEESIEWMKS